MPWSLRWIITKLFSATVNKISLSKIISNGEQHASLKPLISMWLAQASISLLSLYENRDRRIWFIVDELPSLNRLPQLAETIAEVRKFGGCFVLGMQSFSQLENVYNRHAAREIFDLLNTLFFFRSPSSDMAKLVSNELGSQEVEDARENFSYGANRVRDGISIGSQKLTQPLVTYSEIMELPDLTCFLKLPYAYPLTKLSLSLKQRNEISMHYIPRQVFTKGQAIPKLKTVQSFGSEKINKYEKYFENIALD